MPETQGPWPDRGKFMLDHQYRTLDHWYRTHDHRCRTNTLWMRICAMPVVKRAVPVVLWWSPPQRPFFLLPGGLIF
jgi:hypothetical protein